jgi:hypothetical protein
MSIRDGNNWKERLYHGYKVLETSVDDWYFEGLHPFVYPRPYRDGYFFYLERFIERFINHTLYPDIHAMLSDNNGYPVYWTYEDICEYLHEPMLLESGHLDKLKYFLGKFDARYLEHMEKISGLLRYIKAAYPGGLVELYEKAVSYSSDIDPGVTREEAENILNSKLLELWNSTEFSEIPHTGPYAGSSGAILYRNPSGKIREFYGRMAERVVITKINPTSKGILHIYGGHFVNGNADYDDELVLNTGGLYPGVPNVPEIDKFYRMLSIEINDPTPEYTSTQPIPNVGVPPRVRLFGYPEDGYGSAKREYSVGAEPAIMHGFYDIKPDEPDTFLT